MLDTTEQMVSFSALDRCDRCGAQAYAQAEKMGAASVLLFCFHHSKEFMDALLDGDWMVRWDVENMSALVSTPGASAW